METRVMWIVGMLASVAGAVLATATVPEPWSTYLTIVGIVATAITGYQIQHPLPRPWTTSERERYRATGEAPPDAPPAPPKIHSANR